MSLKRPFSLAMAVLALAGSTLAASAPAEAFTYRTGGSIGSLYKAKAATLGAPTSNEYTGHADRVQTFKNGIIIWSSSTGAHSVSGGILNEYKAQKADAGTLGLPVTEEIKISGGIYQQFKGGVIYWAPAAGAHSVRGAIRSLYAQLGAEKGILGYPTSSESAVKTFNGQTVVTQAFQHGAITWNGSKSAENPDAVHAHVVYGSIYNKFVALGGTSYLGSAVANPSKVNGVLGQKFQRAYILSGPTAPLAITTTTLPGATTGTAYRATLAATGGTVPYTWTVTNGTLPPGLTLNAANGTITGIPTRAGTSAFTASATDADYNKSSLKVNLTVGDNWVPFTTSDGAYSFVHPSEWRVSHQAYSTGDVYTVTRKDGTYIATLDTLAKLPDGVASFTYPRPNGVSLDVPGLSRPLGRKVTAVIGSNPGQAPGADSIIFSTADGGDPSKNWSYVQVKKGAYVRFTGSGGNIGNGSSMLTAEQAKVRVGAYIASPEGKSVRRILTSLRMRP